MGVFAECASGALRNPLSEAASEMVITDGATVVIGDTFPSKERQSMIDDFAEDISSMSKNGGRL